MNDSKDIQEVSKAIRALRQHASGMLHNALW
ncbi:MAG: hypothetical protein ACFWUC_00085 [Oscillospiraceae bacterium]|jgi:hypothetical protein